MIQRCPFSLEGIFGVGAAVGFSHLCGAAPCRLLYYSLGTRVLEFIGGAVKLSEIAREVINLADAASAYWESELPKRHPDYPIVHPGEDSGPPPPEEAKLQALLMALPADFLYKLALIRSIGRGDFGTDDLPGHYEALKKAVRKPARVAFQMMETVPLADDLADGLAELQKNHIDADTMLP